MVEMQGVHKWFGHTHVLRGIDLTVPKGTVTTVLGPSGSGKSTALRCINQLEEIGAGRIHVDGVLMGYREGERNGKPTLFRLHPKEIARQRANVGMVFQRFNLFPHMTALGNVTEAQVQVLGRSKDEAHERATFQLERVGLGDRLEHYPAQLSGGQQQRVAIARALAQRPRVILADEPVASLDPPTSHVVMRDLQRINAELGITVVVNLHFLDLARRYGRRLVGMRAGEVVFDSDGADADETVFESIYGRSLTAEDVLGSAHVELG